MRPATALWILGASAWALSTRIGLAITLGLALSVAYLAATLMAAGSWFLAALASAATAQFIASFVLSLRLRRIVAAAGGDNRP